MNQSTHKNKEKLENVKNIIAIVSGKGGVGKSTCAVNLALALKQKNLKVGILDIDIYGPSLGALMGICPGRKPEAEGNKLKPIVAYGLELMSMAFLINENSPVIWRGPIVSQVVQQLIYFTKWSELDYLIIDLPPGTGDIHLTLMQKVPLTAAIVITTPQHLSLIDVRKAVQMLHEVHVPLLGVIENMSQHICSSCGYVEAIFNNGAGTKVSEENNTTLLGQLPLMRHIQEDCDYGKPSMISDEEDKEHCENCDCGKSEHKAESHNSSTQSKARQVVRNTFNKVADRLIDKVSRYDANTGVEIKITDV